MKALRYLFTVLALVTLPILADDGHAEASVSISGTTARSAKLGSGRKLLRCTTAAFYVSGGSAVTATTADIPLVANVPWEVDVVTNQYIAFITSGATGTCYIYPVN